jgi:hypothetical protein
LNSEMALNYRVIVERYPSPNAMVGNSIVVVNILSTSRKIKQA